MGRGGPGRPPGHVTTREELEIYAWRFRGAIGRHRAAPGAPPRPAGRSRRIWSRRVYRGREGVLRVRPVGSGAATIRVEDGGDSLRS